MPPASHWVDANGVRLSVLELGNPRAPALVTLHGMRDVAASPLPGAGHMVHFDEPAALTRAVADFLERRA